jgi:PhzF family phenazine biosynthesis protein
VATIFGGSPAGVVFDAHKLSERELQNIAQVLNATGTAFVYPSEKADFRFRYFSPQTEGDFCSHATIAAIHGLVEQGEIRASEITQENAAGTFPVEIRGDGTVMLSHAKPKFLEKDFDSGKIAKLLGIAKDSMENLPLEIGNTGMNYLIVPLKSLEAVRKVKPNFFELSKFCRENKMGLHVFSLETAENESTTHNRTFCPVAGVYEDPVCGGASGVLGAYLKRHGLVTNRTVVTEQGHEFGRPSKVVIEIGRDGIKVGCRAVTVFEGKMNVNRWQ